MSREFYFPILDEFLEKDSVAHPDGYYFNDIVTDDLVETFAKR
jgi:hypothetical protein|tara:strand:+ start:3842 stop:3970 length:129 start_codon:yes stop_codon:yes gene_type:complete